MRAGRTHGSKSSSSKRCPKSRWNRLGGLPACHTRSGGRSGDINFEEENPIERIREMTDGSRADVCVDAVGLEANQSVPGKTGSLLRLQSGNINALKRAVGAAESLASLASTGQRTTNSRYDRFSTKALVCDLVRPPSKSTSTN